MSFQFLRRPRGWISHNGRARNTRIEIGWEIDTHRPGQRQLLEGDRGDMRGDNACQEGHPRMLAWACDRAPSCSRNRAASIRAPGDSERLSRLYIIILN